MRQRGQTIVSLMTVRSRHSVDNIAFYSVLTDIAAVQFIVRDNSFDIADRRQL